MTLVYVHPYVGHMRTYTAANGHTMTTVSTHTDKEGREIPDYWNATHAATCPCLKSEDWS